MIIFHTILADMAEYITQKPYHGMDWGIWGLRCEPLPSLLAAIENKKRSAQIYKSIWNVGKYVLPFYSPTLGL